MLLTIRNLTGEAITAHTQPEVHKFNIQNQKKKKRTSELTAQSQPLEFTLEPHLPFSTTLSKGFRREIVLRSLKREPPVDPGPISAETEKLLGKEWRMHPEGLKVRLSLALGASWRIIPVPEGCPWRVYIARVTRKHHNLVVMQSRSMASYMATLPDRLPMSSLALPGTHDTMAFYGWPISQCQTQPLLSQLNGGIRVIDIRLAVIPPPSPIPPVDATPAAPASPSTTPTVTAPAVKQELIAYHGIYPQQTHFSAILSDIHAFLTSPMGQKETIVMSIKQEDGLITPSNIFSELVREAMMTNPGGWDESKASKSTVNRGMWFFENRVPTLGEVRGRVVLFSRFGGDAAAWPGGLDGIGIHPTTWPDSDPNGFTWDLKGTTFRTHDWYGIPTFMSIPDKFQRATANLLPPKNPPQPVLPVTFFSAASFPFSLPPIIAQGIGWPKSGFGIEGINSLFGKWLLDQMGGFVSATTGIANAKATTTTLTSTADPEKTGQEVGEEPRIRGWTFIDYFSASDDGQIAPLLVECNFLGRKKGEEGW